MLDHFTAPTLDSPNLWIEVGTDVQGNPYQLQCQYVSAFDVLHLLYNVDFGGGLEPVGFFDFSPWDGTTPINTGPLDWQAAGISASGTITAELPYS